MDPQTITQIQQTAQELLDKLQIQSEIIVEVDESAVVKVNIKCVNEDEESNESPERGVLIGKYGETLHSLQLVLSLVANQGRTDWLQLIVDVDGYRQRREEQLVALAKRVAEKVAYLKEPVALSPMPAIDRRIVHMAIAEIDGVISESTGASHQRRVVVSPA